jgi:hypothetical protein
VVNCEYCEELILFGGVRVGRLRYCRKGCLEKAEEAEYRIGQTRLFYQKCLAQLREDPADPHIREQALEAGRTFAACKRHREGGILTLYDETSIANDIQAASAAVSANQNLSGVGLISIEERLERLAALRANNLLTEEEYNEKRSAILAEL